MLCILLSVLLYVNLNACVREMQQQQQQLQQYQHQHHQQQQQQVS